MKKATYFISLTLFSLIIALSACEKPDEVPIVITKAELIIENVLPLIEGEELKVYVTENAHRDYHIIKPKNYIWTIEDSLGIVIDDDFNNQAGNIKWIAEETGKYTISLTLEYGEDVNKTIKQNIEVLNDFRQIYSGDYHFMKVTDHWTENTGHNRDTTYQEGYVMPDPSRNDFISISCGEGSMGTYHSESFSYELRDDERTGLHMFGGGGGTSYFYGSFKTTDSLEIQAHYGGHGGGTGWSYYGSKIK